VSHPGESVLSTDAPTWPRAQGEDALSTQEPSVTDTLKRTLDQAAIFLAQHPERATYPVAATCELVGATEVDVRMGRHLVKVDEPTAFGGGGTAPSPDQYALGALGSCVALTYRIWSENLGIRIDRLGVEVRADVDTRGVLGLAGGTRPGFTDVRITVQIAGPEPADRYAELRRAVAEHCPILDVFAHKVPVAMSVQLTA
jgi:uncharacterized OsmC-like protein